MKKKSDKLKREAEASVTLEYIREFRAEMMSQFAAVRAEIKQIDAKVDQRTEETKAAIHQVKLLVEEQNLRNKQAYDGYVITYGALQDLKSKIKPECLE